MVKLEKINSSMFSEIYDSFLADDDPYLKKEDWRNLFSYEWDREEDYYGYALVDSANIVGILGMMFSERIMNGSVTKFCNLHNWIVKEEYRGQSLLLMKPILSLQDHVITDFTPTRRVFDISKKIGFRRLDSRLKILPPLNIFASQHKFKDYCITNDEFIIGSKLNEADARLFRDHKNYKCGHLMTYDKDAYCYIIYTRVERHVMPYCYIHYLSNKSMFAKGNKEIRSHLLKHSKERFIAVDSRLLANIKLPFSFNFPLESCQLYRSPNLGPDQIDTLYSEIILLNLTTFPDLSAAFRTWFHDKIWSGRTIVNRGDHALSLQ